jgi:hypothetical protein
MVRSESESIVEDDESGRWIRSNLFPAIMTGICEEKVLDCETHPRTKDDDANAYLSTFFNQR